MPQTKESFLKGRSTGWLLKQFHRNRGCGKEWCPVCCGSRHEGDDTCVEVFDKKLGEFVYFSYTRKELKDELDKRPHLPNKSERKERVRRQRGERKRK